MEHLEAYKQHCIDQAITILGAGHDIKCMFGTPKLLEALCLALEERGSSLRETGITGIFSGGTEFTPQWTRFCVEELFGGPPEESGIYMTPTYGNTLMGLACSQAGHRRRGLQDQLLRPAAAGRGRGRRLRRHGPRRRLRRNRPREADDAHQGILHARLPGTRRRRARTALRTISPGTASAACGRSAAWPRRRRWACTEMQIDDCETADERG